MLTKKGNFCVPGYFYGEIDIREVVRLLREPIASAKFLLMNDTCR
jgi:hypothetical protein